MTIERKVFGSAPIEVADDDPDGTIKCIVSVFSNVDFGKDRIQPGAFKASLERKLPKGVWSHEWDKPIAKTVEAKELMPGDPLLPPSLADLGGLYIKGQFNLETQRGREAYSDLKFGLIDEFSIGYSVVESERDAKGVRDLIVLDVKEWSPVLVGMNPDTAVISVKDAQSVIEQVAGALAEEKAEGDAPPEVPQDAPEATESDDDADDAHTGVMVGWWLPPEVAAQLAVPGGEAPENLHLTLAVLGDTADFDAFAQARLMVAVQIFAQWRDPLDGAVGGYGRFTNAEDGDPDVYYAAADIPALEDLQDDLVDTLSRFGFEAAGDHGFTPHITLAYLPADAPNPPAPATVPLCVDGLTICFGDLRHTLPFPVGPPVLPFAFSYLGEDAGEAEEKITMSTDNGFAPQSLRVHRKGTPVKWKAGSGYSHGKVVSSHTSGPVKEADEGKAGTVFGSKKNPAYKVQVHSKKGDRFAPTDRQVVKRHSALIKMDGMPLAESKGGAVSSVANDLSAKNAPPSGMPFAGEVDAARTAVAACVDRAGRVQEMYRKEGRTLNAANVARLSGMRDELRGHADTLDTMLSSVQTEETGVMDARATVQRARMAFLLTESKLAELSLRAAEEGM